VDFHSQLHIHHARLTPQMRGVLERMHRARRPPLHSLSPEQARAAYAAGADVLEVPRAALARVEDLHIPARDGHALPARLYAPRTGAGLPLLLYLHGGGFTIGSIATHDVLCRELARLADCMVVSLDYRLAPEHPFPTASNDAWDALAWLAAHAGRLGGDPTRLAVGGDSAGGTLAAVNAILARDAGLGLALQLLIYPGTTAHQDTASHQTFARDLVLEGVAPAWIGLAECDPLVDEGIDYADKLRAAGVAVELEIYRGVTHEFIKMGRVIPEARQAHQHAASALRRAFELE